MNRVVDSEQRRQALDPAASFIVQAPAGSGKTELLIQRYLVLLSRVQNPEEIIAITFTRKAAAEMRGRVVTAIDQAGSGKPPVDNAAARTCELAQAVLAHDRELGWQLQDNPGRLQIQTIDSLCARLTRQMPILARLGSMPETIEDASPLYRDAADSLLEEIESRDSWSEDIVTLFSHLDNDMPKIRDLLSGMLARRDQWLRHVTGEISRDELERALSATVTDVLERAGMCIPREHVDELATCFTFAATNMDAGCGDKPGLPSTSAANLDNWRLLADMCLTKNGDWRKTVTVRQGFPAGPAYRDMKDRFRALLSRLSADEELRRALDEIRHLPPLHYRDSEWQIVSALCRLLIIADAGLRVLFGERNQIDFTGIATAAVTALGTSESPTDLALHLDYRIKHLLVDEFQDVSTTQYSLLQLITAGWSPEDEHSLFLVGDPMQSIYRFREADVRLFLMTWEERRLGQVPLTPLNITVNFRSQNGIVKWVNDTFQQLMPKRPDRHLGAVRYVPADAFATDHKAGVVRLHPFIHRDEDREAGEVVSLVQSLRTEYPEGTIAILVRSRAQLATIVPRLRDAGLHFRAVEIEQLGERQAIQDVLALTLAMNRFADRIAWLAILRAPWCGLALTDLYHLAGGPSDRTIWQCMQDPDRLRLLSVDGQERLLKVRAVLELHYAEQGRRNLRRSVESVWISLGGPATLGDRTDLENVQAYFELLEQFAAGVTLQHEGQFFEGINKLFAAPDVRADETLQIMTIHKAKGLEFDTVIVPGLEKGRMRDEHTLLRWEEFPHEDGPGLLLAPIREAGELQSPIYDYLKRREEQKHHFEEQRLLYVAVTRARHRLHLLASVSEKENENGTELSGPLKGSLLYHLWPRLKPDFVAALQEKDHLSQASEKQTGQFANHLHRLASGWRLPAPPEAISRESAPVIGIQADEAEPEFEWAGETIKHIGTVTHRAIRQIAETGVAAWNKDRILANGEYYRGALLRLSVVISDLDWAVDSVIKALSNLISDERGRWILDPSHKGARNEYAVSGLYRGRVINAIIDRTFIDSENVRWIIDYKTSRHEGPDVEAFLDREQERYRSQLEKYGELLRHMEDFDIRLGLYFPLLRGWREMTHGDMTGYGL